MNLKFKRLREDAIVPSKRMEDAGYDLYGCGDMPFCFLPGEVTMVPTGLATEIPVGYVGIIKERGSTGSKGLAVRCGVIDSGYRGEWFVAIVNVSKQTIFWNVDKAIAQVVFVKAEDVEWKEDELGDSERGEGKLGSSGK